MIDVYSHFGTRYSYATIASEVCRALHVVGLLRGVYNLDSDWHADFADLKQIGAQPRASHMLVIAAPNHYIADLVACYDRQRSALFVSPNTDEMAKEHIETVAAFGQAIVTSFWCRQTVQRGLFAHDKDVWLVTLPLGVDDSFVGVGNSPGREPPNAMRPVRALHLTTDTCWPGRKGTEELLEAWAAVVEHRAPMARSGGWNAQPVPLLTVHAPQALERDLLYRVADHGIQDYVTILVEERGTEAKKLSALYAEHDVVVLPSRCEGFGMMILAALVARVPLLTTYVTGQVDFLAGRGGWLAVPTSRTAEIAFEAGMAPFIEVSELAHLLEFALDESVLARLRLGAAENGKDWGTWSSVLPLWVEHLNQWMKEST